MQADAEHQQDDADLGEVIGKFLIGDIARREGADHNPGQQIADQRRDAEAVGDGAQMKASTNPTTMIEIRGPWVCIGMLLAA
jgi:hypothetical protein